jgi:hypothetical protein
MVPTRSDNQAIEGGDQVRKKKWYQQWQGMLMSAASVATLIMAAGAKWRS